MNKLTTLPQMEEFAKRIESDFMPISALQNILDILSALEGSAILTVSPPLIRENSNLSADVWSDADFYAALNKWFPLTSEGYPDWEEFHKNFSEEEGD